MAIEIKVPRLGWSMEEGTFIEWLKREGQTVQAGEPLFAIEGDKAIQEIEAIGSGILRIAPDAPENGETVRVGVTLAFLTDPEEAAPFGRRPELEETAAKPPVAETAPAPAIRTPITEFAPKATPEGRRRIPISPRALRVASELGIDWQALQGTGRTGRIRERDVRNAVTRRPVPVRRPLATEPVDLSTRRAINHPFAERSRHGCWKVRKPRLR